jgi:phosphatidylglycerophosphate synthase
MIRASLADPEAVHWTVPIPAGGVQCLGRRLLGLSFVERRLREAQRWGVAHVHFVGGPDVEVSALQTALREPARCAPWSLEQAEPEPADRTCHYEVPLFALVEGEAPFRPLLELDPQGDWEPAVQWQRQQIIHGSGATRLAKVLNKPVSLALSTRLAKTPIRPNHWSYFNMAVGLASAWFVSRPDYWSMLLGALLFQLASIFDGVDGEIAKFRLEYSDFGAWLDTAVDNLTLLAFLAGCGVHIFLYSDLQPMTAAGLTAVVLTSLVTYLVMQLHFVRTQLGAGSLVAWDKYFFSQLPQTDPVVRFVHSTKSLLKKDVFSWLFFAMGALALIPYLLHLVSAIMVVALASVGYLNTRYGRLADEPHA